jgi:hypothetical protein
MVQFQEECTTAAYDRDVWSTFQAGHVRPCASLCRSDLPQDLAPILLTLKIKRAAKCRGGQIITAITYSLNSTEPCQILPPPPESVHPAL